MKRSGWTELVLGCTLLASGSTAAAESYYVSPTGSATAAGTTGDPWSLEKANAEAQPGDTIVLLDGNYSTSIAPARSGSDGAPITFVAANEHQATFSDGFASAPAVLLTGRGHVIVAQQIEHILLPDVLNDLGKTKHFLLVTGSEMRSPQHLGHVGAR